MSYVVEYRPKYGVGDDNWREVSDVIATEYDVTNLMPFTVYEVRVSAVNNIGRGMASDPVDATTSELGRWRLNTSFKSCIVYMFDS